MEKAVYAVFFKEPDRIANWLDSLHCKCGLFIGNKDGSEGSIFLMFNTFGEYVFKKKASERGALFRYDDGFQFIQSDLELVGIQASAHEIKHLSDICNACSDQKNRTYNFYDKALSVFSSTFSPLPDNVDIYNAPCLHNAQALLLILRAGLAPENTLTAKLKELNSREVYSTQLYRTIVMTGAEVITISP